MEETRYLLKYNLQFFAKDGPGGEKTEEPTSKKLSDTRKEGNVAKSKDLVTAVVLVVVFVLLQFTIGNIGEGFMETYINVYSKIPTYAIQLADEITYTAVGNLFADAFKTAIIAFIPLLGAVFVISFIGDLVQVKWQITGKPLAPKFSKINPISGFKKIFSLQAVVNLLKSLALVGIIFFVV